MMRPGTMKEKTAGVGVVGSAAVAGMGLGPGLPR